MEHTCWNVLGAGGGNWDKDMEHSSGSSWRVWLFLGCLEILESWHTTDRPGPLRNTNSGFIYSYCDEENRALTSHSCLSSISSCASFAFISHFTSTIHPPFLHNSSQGQGSFILHEFQSLTHWGFYGLEFSWFLGWELQSPHQKRRDTLSQAQASAERNPISSLSKTWSLH